MTDDVELREFVYLDALSVYSLLASLGEPVVQKTENIDESTRDSSRNIGLEAEIDAEGRIGELINKVSTHLGASGGVDISKSETARELLRTTSRVNDQYRFDLLYNRLGEQITELPVDTDPSEGDVISLSEDTDVIKVTGIIETDPLYRLANSMIAIEKSLGKKSPKDVEKMMDLYGGKIPLVLQPKDGERYNYIMTVDKSNIWVDELQEFLGGNNYTVVGRLKGRVSENQEWDSVGVLRTADTVFTDGFIGFLRYQMVSESDELRDIGIEEVISELDEETMEKIDWDDNELMRNMKDIEENGVFDVDPSELTVSGPALLIDPIAIYW
ncbi:DUF6414 family protein [Natronoglomus mannanivorans]|uniref:Uncharacterized protein n=1 Tax=Natronoglomus mannanivorans TaxID=2979990 RepID=A0AAP2Z314_9EURY|nr:hypothetical protein [Halobacteria archaeon AArc-xg1-1]